MMSLSALMSFMSMRFISFSHSGWNERQYHPTCAKKNPRRKFRGSFVDSAYLWCTRWTCTQLNTELYNWVKEIDKSIVTVDSDNWLGEYLKISRELCFLFLQSYDGSRMSSALICPAERAKLITPFTSNCNWIKGRYATVGRLNLNSTAERNKSVGTKVKDQLENYLPSHCVEEQ